jgi:hypothetical protein
MLPRRVEIEKQYSRKKLSKKRLRTSPTKREDESRVRFDDLRLEEITMARFE